MRKSETTNFDLDITSILQVLDIEKGRGVLSVVSVGHQMKIFFEQGNVVDIDPINISMEETLEEFLESDTLQRKVSLECENQNPEHKKSNLIPALYENAKNPIFDLDIPSILKVFDIDNGWGVISINYGDINTKIFFEDGNIANVEPEFINLNEIIEEYIRYTESKQHVGFKCAIHSNGDEPKAQINDNLNLTLLPVLPHNKIKLPEQDVKMEKNVELLSPSRLIEIVKKDLGEAIQTINIWKSSNESVISAFNKEPNLVKLFNKISKILNSSLKKSVLPNQNGYYLVCLENQQYALILPIGDFQMGLILDSTKVEIGLVLNVTLPKIVNAFNEMVFDKKEVV